MRQWMTVAATMLGEELVETPQHVWWHGSASGDLRGGRTGLHLGTEQAAIDALEARIGIPADGQGWTGNREYGKTLLAGKHSMAQMGIYPTGINCDAPDDDYYPTQPVEYPDGSIMPMTVRPAVRPYRIIGPMTNNIHSPHADFKANGYMAAQIKRYGRGKRGYYYTNVGEDEGSISAVVPDGTHLEPLSR